MHISKVSLVNYRNFANAKFIFKKGINTIIGENGSGKTNLFRAIRLLLDENMRRSAIRLTEQDFNRGLETWKGHWIIVSLEFEEVSEDESIQSLFLHGAGNAAAAPIEKATYNLIFRPRPDFRVRLSQLEEGDQQGLAELQGEITIADYESVFTGKSEADFNDPAVYRNIVGDFGLVNFPDQLEFPEIGARIPNGLQLTEDISFTFIQALRDVVAEFQNNRMNPLLTLLKAKSGELDEAAFAPIAELAGELNDEIEALPEVQTLREDISSTIRQTAGHTYSPSSIAIRSDLSKEADKLFQALKLYIGEAGDNFEGAIYELSLGGANLIYVTLKLLEFKYQKTKESFANILLIEEPEAHIHTHIQKTLFDRLNFADTQIIYSTHSTQISEVSNVLNVNILARNGTTCEAYQPTVGLTDTQIRNVQRYLDAVRSNLLFAKSVLLVEGDAEEILIPLLVKKVLGIGLDEMGISLINIRSTGFENVARLFHPKRIKKRCAIVTDLDRAFINTAPAPNDTAAVASFKAACLRSQASGVARKTRLDTFANNNPLIRVFYAPHTFEVDFVGSGNEDTVVEILGQVYVDPPTITAATADLKSGDIAHSGRRILTIADNAKKGWLAIMVGERVDHTAVIPEYILDALKFVHPEIAPTVWYNILSYRVDSIAAVEDVPADQLANIRARLDEFRLGQRAFADLKNDMLAAFPADQIHPILARY